MSVLPELSFQDVAQGGASKAEPGGLSELKRYNWKSGETKGARVFRAEYYRGEICTEGNLEIFPLVFSRVQNCTYM